MIKMLTLSFGYSAWKNRGSIFKEVVVIDDKGFGWEVLLDSNFEFSIAKVIQVEELAFGGFPLDVLLHLLFLELK